MENKVDETIEELVFLLNASEGNYGIYELTWELGHYQDLKIDEKYKIAKRILLQLVHRNWAYVQTYKDFHFKVKDRIIAESELEEFLDNPANWYPSSSPLPCLELTQDGDDYLALGMEKYRDAIQKRLFGKTEILGP